MTTAINIDALLALAVLGIVFVAFAREWSSPDVIALIGAGVLLATGVLDPMDLRAVFSNSGPLTIGAMFVLSGALQATGVITLIGAGLRRVAGDSNVRALTTLLIGVMVASAFISNTAVVVFLTPVVISMARRADTAPSRYLIPLSYASILGGTTTLIGTSTNLLVDSVAADHGLEPFTLFELSSLGVVTGIAGIGYLALFAHRLLPERRRAADVLDQHTSKRFLTELLITSPSELVGKPLRSLEAGDTEVVEVARGGRLLDELGDVTLEHGDRVIVRAPAGEAVHLRGVAEPTPDEGNARERTDMLRAGFEVVQAAESVMREGIVGPGSHFDGRAVGSLNLRRLYDVRILAVHRQGHAMRRDFEKVRLQMGDTLLLEAPAESLKRLFDTRELVGLGEPVLQRLKREKAPLAIGTIAALVLLAGFGVMPLVALAMLAAITMLATGCLRPNQAYDAIDWRVLFLVFGMLAIGRGLESSGAVDVVIGAVAALVVELHPWFVLAMVYLAASLLTELITNNAVAIVMTPIAIGIAEQLGVEPRAFVVAVMFAGSASFATPLGYQTNTFVYGAGNYRFTDFLRIGVPLNVLMWIIATALIPLLWPLRPV